MARTISVDAKKLQRKLRRMMSRGLTIDLSKQINESAGIVIKDMKEGIAQGQDINEQPFKPLHPETIRMKREKGMPFPSQPLVGTGAMGGSLGGSTGPYLKKRATQNSQIAKVSAPTSRAPYGIYHQEGATIPVTPRSRGYLRTQGFHLKNDTTSLNLPQRKWFGVSNTAERQIFRNINSYINRMLRG